jgi:hypothetical protein
MKQNATSWSRVAALGVGYFVTLAGVLSIFSIPLYTSLLLIAVGTVILLLSDRTKIPMTRSSWLVLLAGCGLILCALALFGEDRIRHWTPFPAGYIPAWVACFHGFRHVRYAVLRVEGVPNVAA